MRVGTRRLADSSYRSSSITSTNAASIARTKLGRRAITNSGGLSSISRRMGTMEREDGLEGLHGAILGLKVPRFETFPYRDADNAVPFAGFGGFGHYSMT
jgi:hypothetical protein